MDDWRWTWWLENLSRILEVDYAEDLHTIHNDYSLAPERVKIGNVQILIPIPNNKTDEVVHCETFFNYIKASV